MSYGVDKELPTDCYAAIDTLNISGIIKHKYLSQSLHSGMGG